MCVCVLMPVNGMLSQKAKIPYQFMSVRAAGIGAKMKIFVSLHIVCVLKQSFLLRFFFLVWMLASPLVRFHTKVFIYSVFLFMRLSRAMDRTDKYIILLLVSSVLYIYRSACVCVYLFKH